MVRHGVFQSIRAHRASFSLIAGNGVDGVLVQPVCVSAHLLIFQGAVLIVLAIKANGGPSVCVVVNN